MADPPQWLEILAWAYVIVALLCAAFIVVDFAVRGYRQTMPVMEWVWPITAVYMGPLALWLYLRYGRTYSEKYRVDRGLTGSPAPMWFRIGVSTMHCGSGCTVGDVISEWIIYAFTITLAGLSLYASFVLDYAAAWVLGIVFQYFAISEMGEKSFKRAVTRTVKADTLSLTAFEVGLFAWMALMFFVFFPHPNNLEPDSIVFWFLMWIGMTIGFFTSYPANLFLIRRGVKEAM